MAVELIDSRVSSTQAKLAIEALLKHARKQRKVAEETELLGAKEEHVWLVVTSKKMHPEKNLKPFAIPLAHPIIDPRTTSICLITKDPQREYKDLLEKEKIKFIGRVVGVSKLKGKFKGFEARRQLLQEHGMFLADERVIPMMPQLLGKMWFKAKKQPIPVNLTRKDLKGHLERAISNTYMHQNQGTCTSVKIGTISHSHAQLYANIQKVIPAIAKNIRGGWDNVQSLHIKTSTSTSLPIWTCDLGSEEGGRWEGMDIIEEENDEDEDGDENEDSEEDSEGEDDNKRTVKGKKRGAEEPDDSRKKKPRPSSESSGAKKPEKEVKAAKPSSSKPAPNVSAPTSSSTDKKSKSNKKAEASSVTPAVPFSSSPTTSSEKKSKSHSKKMEPTSVSTSSSATAPKKPTSNDEVATDKKKGSKQSSTTAEKPSPATSQPAPTAEETSKPKKKAKDSQAAVEGEADKPTPAKQTTSETSKKPKKHLKEDQKPSEPHSVKKKESAAKSKPLPATTNLSRDDVLKKREGANPSLEAKKKKMMKEKAGKGMGRGAKGAVLGVQ
ncbi:hypothetical protein FRC03_001048 [Tulasnella sp. 419]|nr:hypothetical protein FRC03_001048 [Tulasnella sp. 419]